MVAQTVTLDPRDPVPLWAQLVAVLRERLGSGEYRDRFPTEMELTAEFEVSRATVREAIRRLKDEGLLDARRGSGTFVVRRELDESFIANPGLARAIVAAGMVEGSRVLRFEPGPAGAVASAGLRIAADAEVLWLERLRLADERAIGLDCSALALDPEQSAAFLTADLASGSVYDKLTELCDLHVTGAREQVRAITSDADQSVLLELDEGEGVLEVERVAFAGATPVEWRRSLLRGSAYVLSSNWGVVPAALDGSR